MVLLMNTWFCAFIKWILIYYTLIYYMILNIFYIINCFGLIFRNEKICIIYHKNNSIKKL